MMTAAETAEGTGPEDVEEGGAVPLPPPPPPPPPPFSFSRRAVHCRRPPQSVPDDDADEDDDGVAVPAAADTDAPAAPAAGDPLLSPSVTPTADINKSDGPETLAAGLTFALVAALDAALGRDCCSTRGFIAPERKDRDKGTAPAPATNELSERKVPPFTGVVTAVLLRSLSSLSGITFANEDAGAAEAVCKVSSAGAAAGRLLGEGEATVAAALEDREFRPLAAPCSRTADAVRVLKDELGTGGRD
jgi:hypothetical protein